MSEETDEKTTAEQYHFTRYNCNEYSEIVGCSSFVFKKLKAQFFQQKE